MITRRRFLTGTAAAAGGVSLLRGVIPANAQTISPTATVPLAQPGRDYTPTITPNNVSLPWKIVDGAKVYHLIAEEVKHEFAPGLEAFCWGFNGRVHGPTIEAVEGDRVRIYVTNKLPAATSIHWHGIILPNGMDGISGLTQPPIKPGETFKYEFTLRQHGTHMYHSHHDEMTQMALGLMGLFVIHPRNPKYRVNRDFALMLSFISCFLRDRFHASVLACSWHDTALFVWMSRFVATAFPLTLSLSRKGRGNPRTASSYKCKPL